MEKFYDVEKFNQLVGLGCSVPEICFALRDSESGIPAKISDVSCWCKNTFGLGLKAYIHKYGGASLRFVLRQNQLDLSVKAAPMAVFLGKNYLSQVNDPLDLDLMARLEKLEKETDSMPSFPFYKSDSDSDDSDSDDSDVDYI